MTDQLYRINPTKTMHVTGPEPGVDTQYVMLEEIVAAGVLVPVEIDYEAAKTCQWCEGSGVILEPHDFGMVEQLSCSECRGTGQWINDEAVKWVLSEALGIEGGDDG